jgi:hypothetical protein
MIMANICSFSMMVRGKKESIETFKKMMNQTGTVYMGRGAEIDFEDMEEINELNDNDYRCQIDGQTKWSIQSSLIDNAISMRNDIGRWCFGDDIDKTKLSFVTLFEACEQLSLDMECFSEETGIGFQEHYLFIDGKLIKDECVDYSEEYDEDADEWIGEGGFEWDFEI